MPVVGHPAPPVATRQESPLLGPAGSAARQREHRELTAQRCIVAQAGIATDSAQSSGRLRQPSGKADAGPTTHSGQNGNVLLPVMFVGRYVPDDARGRLEFVELLTGFGIDSLKLAFPG